MSKKTTAATEDFSEVLRIIRTGRAKAFEAVNVALMDTYWAVGGWLSRKVAQAGWGKGVVKELAGWIQAQAPEVKGFSAQNLWRMKQFYKEFSADPKLSVMPRVLSWTYYCILLGQCKTPGERYFYALASERGRWSKRELEAQIARSSFERTMLAEAKLSPLARVLPTQAAGVFKDSYLVEFLGLPAAHSEADLQRGLLDKLKSFLIELGLVERGAAGGVACPFNEVRIDMRLHVDPVHAA